MRSAQYLYALSEWPLSTEDCSLIQQLMFSTLSRLLTFKAYSIENNQTKRHYSYKIIGSTDDFYWLLIYFAWER